MTTQTFLLYLAPVVLAAESLLDQSKKWRKGLIVLTLVVAEVLLYMGRKEDQTALAQVRKDAAVQADRISVQTQDLQARLVAQEERSRLIAEGCISDPKLRKKAEAVHPNLQRALTEQLHVIDKVTATVTRAGGKRAEPPKP
jgi:hypothetical protein